MYKSNGNPMIRIVISLAVIAALWGMFSLLGSGCANRPPENQADAVVVVQTDAAVDAPAQHYTFCPSGESDLTHGCCTDGSFQRPPQLEGGMWVRTTRSSTVYYYGSDGKRYVFPTLWTLVSWGYAFDDPRLMSGAADLCANVVQVNESMMNAVPLGGNIRYRPGSYATGTESDPSRWVIARGGTLRRLADPGMVEGVYPQSSDERTHLLPEPFFTNYRLGEPLNTLTGFDAEAEFDQATLEAETVQAPPL